MRIPWPRVCTGYTVNLNHLCLAMCVCVYCSLGLAHLLMLWREMEKAYLELGRARGETAGMEDGWGD